MAERFKQLVPHHYSGVYTVIYSIFYRTLDAIGN
jgi:hypothetical protein